MGLKQDIVIVNEFSQPLPGGGSSRGATPGAYVTRYMARELATETVAPIRRSQVDDFVLRYMARSEAVETAGVEDTPQTLKTTMAQAQGQGGVAFGYGQVSLSHDQLQAASADLQQKVMAGKTWMKTVISFDEDYLRRHHLVPEDFELSGRGGYRGNLDQMKLRLAVMNGLDRMSSGSGGFDDLRYVGVIQVDTEHVHCHLAMVDAGVGQLRADGTQRGKLLDKHKSRLRRGVDAWLDEKQVVAHLSSAVGYERRNVTSHIKRWAMQRIQREALPQLLVACLPADRKLWRAGTNDARMQRANRLVTELVEEQLEAPGSPLPAAMDRVREYADHRRELEGRDRAAHQKLVDTGRAQITERAVNGVYSVLQALPQEQLKIRTPALQVMTMDYEQLAARNRPGEGVEHDEDEFTEFGYRMRSYSSRLRDHRQAAKDYGDLAQQWRSADEAGVADAASRPLYDFYSYERDWHQQLMAKYQHYLPIFDEQQLWLQRQQEILEYGQRLQALMAMRNDASLQRMRDARAAEALGRGVYDQPGGALLTQGKAGRKILESRIQAMSHRYSDQVAAFQDDLASSGQRLVLRADASTSLSSSDPTQAPALATGEQSSRVLPQTDQAPRLETAEPAVLRHPRNVDRLQIDPRPVEDFEDVKALDLHHLGFDYTDDVPVGDRAFNRFRRAAIQRQRRLEAAVDYLRATDQREAVQDLPQADVHAMQKLARSMSSARRDPQTGLHLLPSRIAELRRLQAQRPETVRSATTELDSGLSVSLQRSIEEAVQQTRQPEPAELESGPRQSQPQL